MSIIKINDDDNHGFTIGYDGDEVEYVDPIKYYSDAHIHTIAAVRKEMLKAHDPFRTAFLPREFFLNEGRKSWDEMFGKVMATDIPPNFLKLLNSESKGEQERLLKDQSISIFQLGALVFRSSIEFGYTFSSYKFEGVPKGTDESKLPNLIKVENDIVHTSGPTTMTPGQLKVIVSERKVIIAKVLDSKNKDAWHCFLLTYRSLRGEENAIGGQPHLHYISDKWGNSRDEVVRRIKEGNYSSTRIHIPLIEDTAK